MHPSLNIALRAARDGAATLIGSFDRLDRVKILQDSASGVLTSAHLDAEEAILQQLQKTFPRHGYRSATGRLQDPIESDTTWLLTPLTGTRNFLRGSHGFLLGIACKVEHKITLAVLVDPLLNEEFTAVRGTGASRNGHRIRVGNRTTLDDCVVAMEMDAMEFDAIENGVKESTAQVSSARESIAPAQSGLESGLPALQLKLLRHGAGIRSTGSALLDMVYTAAGRFDGGLTVKPSSPIALDTATMLLREAGGLVSDLSGNPALEGDELVFSNPKLFKQLLQLPR